MFKNIPMYKSDAEISKAVNRYRFKFKNNDVEKRFEANTIFPVSQ